MSHPKTVKTRILNRGTTTLQRAISLCWKSIGSRFRFGTGKDTSLANTEYLCHAEGHILPFWAQRQLSPESPSFQSPLDSRHFGNTAYRSWTTLRNPENPAHLTVDPVGMCSPNGTWSLDIWVMQDGQFFNLATVPNSQQTFENGVLTVTTVLPGVHMALSITLASAPSPSGYLSITLSETTSPLSLFLAIRPYGVTDVFPIRDLTYLSDGAMMVNKQLGLVLLQTPQNVLCLPFSEGDTAAHIGRWEQLLKTTCPAEFASGFVEYRISQEQAQIQAWLPLNHHVSFAEDLIKPLEQAQLKTWIQTFKNQTPPQTSPSQTDSPSSHKSIFQRVIDQQIYHLTQAQHSNPDQDPWEWWTAWGLLAWTPSRTPQALSICQNSVAQRTATFKKSPSPMSACLTLLMYQNKQAILGNPPAEILQNAIKIAMATRLSTHVLPPTSQSNPLDHAFGKGPYWLTYFWAWGILDVAIPMTPEGPPKNALLTRKNKLEAALETALAHWTHCQQLPPMLPIGNTRWQEPGIVTSLLSVFPLSLIDAQNIRVSNTLLTLQNHFLHQDLLFSRAHPAGYPLVENLLLAMVYLLRQDPRCKPILAWAMQQVSPTGTLPKSLHPITHMGATGTGHHLAASGLFLTVFRHALVQESSTGYQIGQWLPAACWTQPWTFTLPIAEGSLHMRYTPASVLEIENQCPSALSLVCHAPEGYHYEDSDNAVLNPGEKRPFFLVEN